MASISSTNSSTSLGNTSLRGFGGMVSGIDRDSIVEQMTLGTTTKINNKKKAMTQLQWKQEAYRNLSDQIINMEDKYFSYSSSSSLKDASVFGRSKITVHGSDDSAKFVTATGTSSLVDNVSIKGVQQLATSSVQRSSSKMAPNGLATDLSNLNKEFKISNLEGRFIEFGVPGTEGKWVQSTKYTFESTYTDNAGKTHTINYLTDDPDELVKQLNKALKYSDATFKIGENESKKIGEVIKFTLTADKQIRIADVDGNEITGDSIANGYVIKDETALSALGYKKPDGESDEEKTGAGIGIGQFNKNASINFADANNTKTTALSYMTGKKLTFNYDGKEKAIELITAAEAVSLTNATVADVLSNANDTTKMIMAEELKAVGIEKPLDQITVKDIEKALETHSGNELLISLKDDLTKIQDKVQETSLEEMRTNLQNRLNKAFGEGAVTADIKDGVLTFTTKDDSTVSVKSSDSNLLRGMGLEYGSSNKINMNGKLSQAALGIDEATIDKGLVINGVTIKGITKDSSISDILSKINSNKDVGVKATYVDATGQFMLVSSETGKGRKIDLGDEGSLAQKLFGNAEDPNEGFTEGQNAIVYVSYGNGINVGIERSSNTFNLEGLNVTVSGTFGLKTDAEGNVIGKNNATIKGIDVDNVQFDSSQTVTFTAKADVDGVTEKVKSFFEDFNALVTEIGTQVRTRPDNSYGPLTDEQKAEMDDTSIENWEKKAKQGVLYGDSAVRDLSAAIEGIFTRMMQNGASYEDLKAIGITYSEDYLDGGTLVFDEAKFREAMESNPDKVANIFTGGGGVSKGLIDVVDETFSPYATRYSSKNGNSYGRFIEIAGSEKKPTSLLNNEIYKQLKEMEDAIASLQERLKTEQDRYISQFTTMESLISKMNTQQSYLSQITG